MLCEDGGLNEKLGIHTQRDGNNSVLLNVKLHTNGSNGCQHS